ncbi:MULTISPECIES: hypothetical protein [unclassified Bacillus (in: firmicutes)]|uniref:hypothetical protein n=1 Tax=unclassified Bacillus (in: firmicutes) TaxID=185979 RepID=UPI000BF5C0D8|nr:MULTISPECIES: hypothetical protein [unclassified Bacillus (in: firmicutes)]PEU18142.1 hypothetical protein CN525_13060 [Bacillus sp. AFS014408]PFW62411.1 hypothetical protein COL20_13270 [Bacillus sp. AFS075034]
MKFLFEHGSQMQMYIRILRIQKIMREYHIPFPLHIKDFHRDKWYLTSDLLYQSLAHFNEQTRIYEHFAFGTDEELMSGKLYDPQTISFHDEDVYAELTSEIFTRAAEGCYFDTNGYYLCLGSKYLTQPDFNTATSTYRFNTYFSEKHPNYMLIEFLEDGYEQYSFEEWVLGYYEIVIRLAAVISAKAKGKMV